MLRVSTRLLATTAAASSKMPATTEDSINKMDNNKVVAHEEEALPPLPEPPKHQPPAFFFKGRRGISAPQYYSTLSAAGHPDELAVLLGAGRTDTEWMWLKLMCFICVISTIGVWLFGKFFPEHIKVFKDEPWSPFDR